MVTNRIISLHLAPTLYAVEALVTTFIEPLVSSQREKYEQAAVYVYMVWSSYFYTIRYLIHAIIYPGIRFVVHTRLLCKK